MPMTFAVVQQCESRDLRDTTGDRRCAQWTARQAVRDTPCCRWRQQKMRSPFHDRQGSTRRGNFPQRLLGLQPPTIGQDLHTGELG
jgi:hypothetical protein